LLVPLAVLFFFTTSLHSERSDEPIRWVSGKSPQGDDQQTPSPPDAGAIVMPVFDRSDQRVSREIIQHLKSLGLLDHAYLAVHVTDGMVTLSGIVASAAERRRAIQAAWATTVRHVEASRLTVAPWLARLRSSPGTDSSNTDADQFDPDVPAYRLGSSAGRPQQHVPWPGLSHVP